MKINKLPPLKYLKECFSYEPNTGNLYWRDRPREHFATEQGWKTFKWRWPGALALNSGRRYKHGHLDYKHYAAHRVIWKLMTGKEPPPVLDPKDRNKQNNRWKNLRAATKAQNCKNRKMSGNNSSGHTGVHWHAQSRKWVAQLGARETSRYLGIFKSKKKAVSVWKKAAIAHYGEFAA